MILYPENLTRKIGFEAVRDAALQAVATPMGEEHIADLAPTSDMVELRQRLQHTDEMMRILRFDEGLPFDGLYDIRAYLRRARVQRSILDPQALQQIGAMAGASRRLKQFLINRNESHPGLAVFGGKLLPAKELEDRVHQVIAESGDIKDSASNALRNIRRTMHTRRAELRTTLERIMREAAANDMASDEGMTLRSGRMVIPIRAEHKRKMQGFIHDVSATGHTVYLEPVQALHLNNEIRQLEIEEAREIERLLMELTDLVRKYGESLADNTVLIGELDRIHALARVSVRLEAHIPEWGTAELRLERAFNPHLMLKKQREGGGRKDIVALDLALDAHERILLITGPNAGGKSVALKTLGLCVVMLQCGFAVPVGDGSQMPVFDRLFVDLGDDQSVENDLSTFSSRLTWMRDTLDGAGRGSLVLVDEAGTGTDPEEGAALYQAFMEEMASRGALLLATTHHGHLKIFAHDHAAAVNASMEFDPKTLSPTYVFRKGIPGSSYAFEIAARIGVDERLLWRARKQMGTSKNRVESLILELQTKTREADLKAFQAEITLREAEAKRNEWDTKQKAIRNEQTKMRQKALQDAKTIILSAQKQVDEALKAARQSGGDKEAVREVRRKMKETVQHSDTELTVIEAEKMVDLAGEPPVIGDTIRFLDSKSTGELLEISGKDAVVLVNGMRMRTKLNKLIKVAPERGKRKKPEVAVRILPASEMPVPVHVPITLDIRGLRVDEAERRIVRYVDDVILTGLRQVEIIHGKGDGVLRKMVHDHLASRTDVRKYYTPQWDMGGPGVTVVET